MALEIDLRWIEKNYLTMPAEEFALLKRRDLTPEVAEIYDRVAAIRGKVEDDPNSLEADSVTSETSSKGKTVCAGANDQAQEDQAQDDEAIQPLPKQRRPTIEMLASGVFGAVIAVTAVGLIVDDLPKTVQIPAFICLLVVLAPTLSAIWHWLFIVRPKQIRQKLLEKEILKDNTDEDGELLDQQELADNESNGGDLDQHESDQGDLGQVGLDETKPQP